LQVFGFVTADKFDKSDSHISAMLVKLSGWHQPMELGDGCMQA
jgi:hypothetical protein